MNGIVITDRNIEWIASRMKKFFRQHEIVGWHSFDCGGRCMKKRIPTYFYDKHGRYKTVRRFRHVDVGVMHYKLYGRDIPYIYISSPTITHGSLYLGDVIKFSGNRIQCRTNWHTSHRNYRYRTYQIWDSHGGLKNALIYEMMLSTE